MKRTKRKYRVNWKRVFQVFWPFFIALVLIIGVGIYNLISYLLPEEIPVYKNLHFGDIEDRDIRVREKYKSRFMVKEIYESITDNSVADETDAQNIIFMNAKTGEVLAAKNKDARIYPASMTKIMTLITALDYINDFEDTFTVTREITDHTFLAGATAAGFEAGEQVKIIDLLYGLMLPSGADASESLALYVAGSESEFASLMNKKASKIGLKNSNFVNASGLHDDEHYSTVSDIALIIEYAMRNELCYEIMSSVSHTTSTTEYHEDGIELYSTLFSRMTGSEPENAVILAGKTGFTDQAGQCLATYGVSEISNTKYICVSSGGSDKWETAEDAINMFSYYAK